MNTTPKFHVNLWGNLSGNLNAFLWPNVTKAWNEKRYQDSIYALLDYINPGLRSKYGNSTQTQFTVPHGSVVVDIQLKDDKLNVACPLVDISEAMRVPLLRKIAELNFWPLTVAQIKLSGNNLTFHYTATLDTCEPFKTYYVLKEICTTADRYDDELREKFKAKSFVTPKVTYPAPDVAAKAWDQVTAIIEETFGYQVWCDSQRWFGSSVDFYTMGLKRLDLCIQTQGYLKTELERALGELANGQIPFADRIQTGRKFMEQLKQNGKEAFAKYLYQSDTFVPEKASINGARVSGMIKNATGRALKFDSEKNHIASVIESLYCIYDLFYANNMEATVNVILISALTNASGKPWADASAILLNGLHTIETTFPVNSAN